jgi:hypothetical protein
MGPAIITVAVVLAVGVGVYFLTRRRVKPVAAFESEREEALANAVARKVGCSPAAALAAVRQELDHSPGQSDDVLTKRAVYHYQQSIPERTCNTYRDSAPG